MRDGFVQASYLELTGNEYINTYFKPNNNSKVVIDCQAVDATFASYTAIFGARNNNSNQFWIYTDKTTANTETWTARWYGTGYNLIASFTDRHLITLENSKFTIDDDSISISNSNTFSSSYYLYIGDVNNAGNKQYPSKIKIYSCKIYDNGTLVRNFIPCLEECSNHIGLYDVVNDIFYRPFGSGYPTLAISKPIIGNVNTNNGVKPITEGYVNVGGSYKKILGAYVFKPEQYIYLDYIESNGNQYINTEVIPTGKTKISIDFQMIDQGTAQQAIFGSRNGTSNRFTLFTGKSTSALQADYGTYGTLAKETENITTVSLNLNDRNLIEMSNTLTINGTQVKQVSEATFSGTTYPLYLFANNNTGSVQLPPKMKIYSCKIYEDGVLIRNYIPARRGSNGMIGFYESHNNKFYCNDLTAKDKIPSSKRSCVETVYYDYDHNTNAKWVWNNSSNFAGNAKVSMASNGTLSGEANILMKPGADNALSFAKYNYDYGYTIPYTNLKSSDCTLVSIKITNSSGTEITTTNPSITVGDNHVMYFSVNSTALLTAAAGNYTLTITVTRNSVTCRFDIPIVKIDTASRYFTGTNTDDDTRFLVWTSLTKMSDNRSIVFKSFTAEALVPTWTITGTVSGASYGFTLTSDGYYTSNNAGVNSSAAVCRVNFTNNTGAAYTVTFNCINYAEANFDYGIIGKINTALSTDSSADSTYTKSFNGSSSSGIQTVTLSVPTGTSYVDIKYLKDSSQHSNNDSLKFKIVV